MTAHIIYKIINSQDDKIYIGSTHQSNLRKRFDGHKKDARDGNPKAISQHMREVGIEHFNIVEIKTIYTHNSKIAKIQEQIELWAIPPDRRLNTIRAHIPNIYYRGNIEAKRANRRAFYNRHKEDPVWMAAERERNKLRMRAKRALP